MSVNKKIILLSLVLLGSAFLAGQAKASVLSVVPKYGQFSLGESFIADIRLNSEGEVINAVQATITYPADLLEIVSLSSGGSFLTLWVEEPKSESSAGVVTLSGGIPNGSYVVDGRVATMTFRAKATGAGEIEFNSANTSVHLNDGQGTAANLKFTSGVMEVSDSQQVIIESSTHPDENKWYVRRSLTVNWSVEKESLYSYVLSNNPDEQPDNKGKSGDGIVTFPDLSDGVYYFILFRKLPDKEWAVIGKRRAMIDSQAPVPFEAAITRDKNLYDNKYFVIFSTVDKTSGIDHYDIVEGGQAYTSVKSPFVLRDQSQKSPIAIKAYDRAGNVTEYSFGSSKIIKSATSLSKALWLILEILIIGLAVLFLLFFVFKLRPKK